MDTRIPKSTNMVYPDNEAAFEPEPYIIGPMQTQHPERL